MDYKQFAGNFLLRLDKGEEIVATLQDFCSNNSISLGSISGLGAINQATMRFFNTNSKSYEDKTMNKPMEITSLTGNITNMDGNTYLHLHVNAAGADYITYGGHLLSATVSATAEIWINAVNATVERSFNQVVGLNTLDFQK